MVFEPPPEFVMDAARDKSAKAPLVKGVADESSGRQKVTPGEASCDCLMAPAEITMTDDALCIWGCIFRELVFEIIGASASLLFSS